ncbi:uncharacterized protein LOC143899832 isoform X1 [Temnothorax americanus]|uniref:uncharacterized protein LOC143899832 isoform X1 n=2 Tax=Temnothorax americanus TaxID=1964332 RepID=UPI004068AFF5
MSVPRSPARRHRHRHHHRRDHCPAIAGCFAVIEDFLHKCIDRANLRRRHRHRHRLHRRRSSMMEASVADLLKNWGFEKFVSIFEENEVNMDAMKVMTYEDVVSLISKAGPRIKFWSKLQEWQSRNENAIAINNSTDIELSLPMNPVMGNEICMPDAKDLFEQHPTLELPIEIKDIELIIPSTSQQQANSVDIIIIDIEKTSEEQTSVVQCKRNLKNSVNEYIDDDAVNSAGIREAFDSGTFTEKHRLKLSRLIITKEFKNDTSAKIRPERFLKLAAEISEVFPGEDARLYYIPRCVYNGKEVAPKGKLYNQYTNLVKKFRLNDLRGKSAHNVEEKENNGCNDDDTSVANDLAWLSIRLEPWTTVQEKWQATSKYRLAILQKQETNNSRKRKNSDQPPPDKVSDYIEKYRALRSPDGYTLLELDFLQLYPQSDINLTSKWTKFVQKVLEFSPSEIDSLADESPVTILHKFAKLFEPVVLNARIGKFKTRPTRAEIAEGLVLHVKVIDDLMPAINRMRSKAEQLKTTLQPLAAVVGLTPQNITASYVAIDDILYKLDSPLRAVDVCFKCIHALHAQYPVQSERPWLVLQQIIYDIYTPWDAQIPAVIQMCKKFALA